MAAGQAWMREAVSVLVNELGREGALRLVRRLRAIPSGSQSMRDTLVRLESLVEASEAAPIDPNA